jgi:hypothetical protein
MSNKQFEVIEGMDSVAFASLPPRALYAMTGLISSIGRQLGLHHRTAMFMGPMLALLDGSREFVQVSHLKQAKVLYPRQVGKSAVNAVSKCLSHYRRDAEATGFYPIEIKNGEWLKNKEGERYRDSNWYRVSEYPPMFALIQKKVLETDLFNPDNRKNYHEKFDWIIRSAIRELGYRRIEAQVIGKGKSKGKKENGDGESAYDETFHPKDPHPARFPLLSPEGMAYHLQAVADYVLGAIDEAPTVEDGDVFIRDFGGKLTKLMKQAEQRNNTRFKRYNQPSSLQVSESSKVAANGTKHWEPGCFEDGTPKPF